MAGIVQLRGDKALTEKSWVEDVLAFWFGELKPADWFEQKEATDDAIRTRFAKLHASLFEKAPSMSFDDPNTALAAILVFDQFPRNMFRGQPQAFATDDIAVAIARNSIEHGLD